VDALSAPKRQHTLPRFYLSGFCNREAHITEGHERDRSRCRVWVHDKREGLFKERGVKNLTTKSHYYSLETPGGGMDPHPELELSRLEGDASRTVRSLYFGRSLSREEAETLAVFFASMKFRVTSYRSFAHEHVKANKERIKATAFPDPETVGRMLRRAGHPEASDPEAVERIFREARHGPMALELTKNHNIQHMFDHSIRVAGVLLGQDWTFAWAPKGLTLVTSDDPVLVTGPDLKAPEGYWGGVGFLSPGATKILPLTQRVCLVVESGYPSIGHARLDEEGVRTLNEQQARHYARYLITVQKAVVEDLVYQVRSEDPGTASAAGWR